MQTVRHNSMAVEYDQHRSKQPAAHIEAAQFPKLDQIRSGFQIFSPRLVAQRQMLRRVYGPIAQLAGGWGSTPPASGPVPGGGGSGQQASSSVNPTAAAAGALAASGYLGSTRAIIANQVRPLLWQASSLLGLLPTLASLGSDVRTLIRNPVLRPAWVAPVVWGAFSAGYSVLNSHDGGHGQGRDSGEPQGRDERS